ncbi:hypothetical protein AB0B54_26190 [Microbispora bryophytorum]|uniref:hypothetical protein n=1 Tax=Microbispora bryophytorum TaxID=1460882 RepID=UPI0033F03162
MKQGRTGRKGARGWERAEAANASRPDAAGVEELARLWLSVSSHDVYPVSAPDVLRTLAENLPLHPLRGALRALGVLNYTFPINPATLAAAALGRRNYLFDNSSLRRFLDRILPIRRLEETRTPLSVLTADVRTHHDGTVRARGRVNTATG